MLNFILFTILTMLDSVVMFVKDLGWIQTVINLLLQDKVMRLNMISHQVVESLRSLLKEPIELIMALTH